MESNEKQAFPDRELINWQEVQELVDSYGVLKLQQMRLDTQFIAKIVGQPTSKTYVFGGEEKSANFIDVEYKHGLIEPVKFKVQASAAAMVKMCDKYPDDAYLGKYAFFTKGKSELGVFHSISIIQNLREDVKEQFKPKEQPKAQVGQQIPAKVAQVIPEPKPLIESSVAPQSVFVLNSLEKPKVKEIVETYGGAGLELTENLMSAELMGKGIVRTRAMEIAKYLCG